MLHVFALSPQSAPVGKRSLRRGCRGRVSVAEQIFKHGKRFAHPLCKQRYYNGPTFDACCALMFYRSAARYIGSLVPVTGLDARL